MLFFRESTLELPIRYNNHDIYKKIYYLRLTVVIYWSKAAESDSCRLVSYNLTLSVS